MAYCFLSTVLSLAIVVSASSLVQPPSLFSIHSLPPFQAVHAPAALDSISQQPPDPDFLKQFLAVTSELEQSQARTAVFTQETLALRARQRSLATQLGTAATHSIPTHPVMTTGGTVHSQLFVIPPLKQRIVVGPVFSHSHQSGRFQSLQTSTSYY